MSHTIYASSLLSPSTIGNNLHGSNVRAVMDHCSDDSDSETFRVKRRSSLKVGKRTFNDAMSSKNSEHQVLFFEALSITSDSYYMITNCDRLKLSIFLLSVLFRLRC